MDWLKLYSLNIAVVLIFSTFFGLVLPVGRYKEYVKLVTGLMVILVIISPMAELVGAGGYEALFKQAEGELNINITGKESKIYDDTMVKTVLEVYRSDITVQLSEKIAANGYSLDYAYIYIDESDEKFGSVTGLELTLSKREAEKHENAGLIKVDKIRLEPIGKESKTNATEDSQEIKTIKNLISDFNNLSVDNIYIKMQ